MTPDEIVRRSRAERVQMRCLLLNVIDIAKATDPVQIVMDLKENWTSILPVIMRFGHEITEAFSEMVDCPIDIAAPILRSWMEDSGLDEVRALRMVAEGRMIK